MKFNEMFFFAIYQIEEASPTYNPLRDIFTAHDDIDKRKLLIIFWKCNREIGWLMQNVMYSVHSSLGPRNAQFIISKSNLHALC